MALLLDYCKEIVKREMREGEGGVSTSVGLMSKFCDTNLVPISDFL